MHRLLKRWKKLRRELRSQSSRGGAIADGDARPVAHSKMKQAVEPTPFAYHPPPANDAVKQVVRLARTEIMRGAVQVVRNGGEESLHLHEGQDGFWMVLRGRARFHGPDDTLLGEFGPHEGILIPRECAYRYESIGDGDLEMLQLLAFDRRGRVARRNLEPRQLDDRCVEKLDGRVAGATAPPDR